MLREHTEIMELAQQQGWDHDSLLCLVLDQLTPEEYGSLVSELRAIAKMENA